MSLRESKERVLLNGVRVRDSTHQSCDSDHGDSDDDCHSNDDGCDPDDGCGECGRDSDHRESDLRSVRVGVWIKFGQG